MKKFCVKNNCLFIVDEVQSGFGRTGKLFAYEHFDIDPDIIVCGKAISSSLPLSAVITTNNISSVDESFNSTHGGNPLAVAASLESLKIIVDEDLVNESERKGKILEYELMKWKNEMPEFISKIFCKGLLASVFINSPSEDISNADFVDMLIEEATRRGLMSIRTASGTLKIGPPLCITDDALIEGISVLKESLYVIKSYYV
jgi:4-aminobutyrate aminotransferase-like enzyme